MQLFQLLASRAAVARNSESDLIRSGSEAFVALVPEAFAVDVWWGDDLAEVRESDRAERDR
jgi:hypothetical protein